MLSHWMIKLLDVVFVISLGIVSLWLFYRSLTSDRVRRSSPSKRAELFLRVNRNNAPFLKIPLEKSHYLIGRGSECEVLLKGIRIPLRVGEIRRKNGDYIFKNFHDNSIMINNTPIGKNSQKILPGDQILIYNYTITIQNA